jgi:hypothetical protein
MYNRTTTVERRHDMKNQNRDEIAALISIKNNRKTMTKASDKNAVPVSYSRESKWTEITDQVIRENIGAWKTLSKE